MRKILKYLSGCNALILLLIINDVAFLFQKKKQNIQNSICISIYLKILFGSAGNASYSILKFNQFIYLTNNNCNFLRLNSPLLIYLFNIKRSKTNNLICHYWDFKYKNISCLDLFILQR